jgi:two-component system phosphate regulon response regulator OmpR
MQRMIRLKEPAHILIINDEPLLQRFLQVSLQEFGYIVHSAMEVQEVRNVLYAVAIDLVLLDAQLRGMNSNSLCTELRRCSTVPIIIMSALSQPADILDGFRAGADDYLTKPFQLREMELRIARLLHKTSRRT